MITWFVIDGDPVRQFYSDNSAVAYLDPAYARHKLMMNPGAVIASTDGENPNISITLKNENGQCTEIFTTPPLCVVGTLSGLVNGVETQLFTGVISECVLSANECTLQVDA